jgi:SET domain-containing protein
MLLVKTRLGMSPIEGIGVFADEFIAKGTPTWKFTPGLDQLLSREVVEAIAEPMKSALLRYSYLDRKTGLYIYCLDNARFVNHSDDANTKGDYPDNDIFGRDIATRDIQPGEEITCNYAEFDMEFRLKVAP